MKVRITVAIDDDDRKALRFAAFQRKKGLASRIEVREWLRQLMNASLGVCRERRKRHLANPDPTQEQFPWAIETVEPEIESLKVPVCVSEHEEPPPSHTPCRPSPPSDGTGPLVGFSCSTEKGCDR